MWFKLGWAMFSDNTQLFIYRWLLHGWRWRLMLWLPMVLLSSLAVLKGQWVAPRYQSQTVLLLQESALANPFLQDLSVAVQLKQRLAGLTALLRSRQLLQQVAEDGGLVAAEQPLSAALRQQLGAAVSLQLMGDSLIRLAVIWSQPAQAQQLLEAFSQRFQQRLMAPGQRAVADSQTFLAQQLQRQEQSVLEVEQQLAEFKQQNAALLPDLLGANNMALLDIDTQIRQQKMAIGVAQSQLSTLTAQLASTNPLISEIEQQIVSTQAQLAQLQSRYTARHSEVQAAVVRLQQLQQEKQRLLNAPEFDLGDHLDNLWQLATTLPSEQGQSPILVSQLIQMQQAQNQVAALTAELQLLQQHRQGIATRMTQSAAVEQRLGELERLATGRRTLYQELLLRFEKARVTNELGQFEAPTKVQLIDPPSYPSRSLNWPWWLNLLLGGLAGLLAGLGWITLSCLLDRALYGPIQVQRLLQQHDARVQELR